MMTLPPNVRAPEAGLPASLDGLLTEAEQERYALLARNAEIRRRFVEMREPREDGAQRTVTGCCVALAQDPAGPGWGLTPEAIRKLVYGVSRWRDEVGARPWLGESA